MEELLKNGSALAVIAALGFFIVGLFQWVLGLTKANDKKRNELLDQIENCRLDSARLKGQLIIYSDKLTDMEEKVKDYRQRYLHFKKLYEDTQLDPEPENPPKPPDLN